MSFQTALFLLSVIVTPFASGAEPHGAAWGYALDGSQGKGPDEWDELPGTHCAEANQSPINIKNETYEGEFPPFAFTHTLERFIIMDNTQHGVRVAPNDPTLHRLSGGPLDGHYNLLQFHFHWGREDDRGSEHAVNDHTFPLEVHFVHYHESYSSANEAVGSGDPAALAVIGVMFELSDRDNEVIDGLQHRNHFPHGPFANYTLDHFDFASIFAQLPTFDFYTYSGSLTTPPCSEVVRWIVMRDVLAVSSEQMELFREVSFDAGEQLWENHRPLQPTNERSILRSWEHVEFVSECGTCIEDHGEPGCSIPDVEACVCDLDPWCCEDHFDHLCVVDAEVHCGCHHCGNCMIEHIGSGCNVATIEECVCASDSNCCNENADFDAHCAEIATNECGCQSPI